MQDSKIIIERTFDPVLIKMILEHPEIIKYIADDKTDHEVTPVIDDRFYYCLVKSRAEIVGLFYVHPHNSVMYEVHTNILPEHRDKSLDSCRALWVWLCDNTPMKTLITQVPVNNKPAKRLAAAFGFEPYGIIPKAWIKGGELHDIEIMGATKCQQLEQ